MIQRKYNSLSVVMWNGVVKEYMLSTIQKWFEHRR